MGFFEWLILGFVALGLFAGNQYRHWHALPWLGPILTGDKGELLRVPSYVYGVTWILGGLALWCNIHPEYWPAFRFALFCALAAAAGTIIPRAAEREAEVQAREGDYQDVRDG